MSVLVRIWCRALSLRRQQAIAGAEGADYITSSSVNSSSSVVAHINPSYDSDQVLTGNYGGCEVRGELPKESEDPVIKKRNQQRFCPMCISD